MGTFAASGEYYVALGFDRIFANGASITGSIGMMSGFLNFHDFDKKFGIQSESLSTGKYMDTYSEDQTFTNDKKAMVSQHQQKSYRRFLSSVQESRQLTDNEVSSVAQGQFMTGKEAKAMGVIDEFGSYTDTTEALKRKSVLKMHVLLFMVVRR